MGKGVSDVCSERIKYAIVDDIAGYVKRNLSITKDDCQILLTRCIESMKNITKRKFDFEISFCHYLFMLLIECICRIVQ